MPRPKFEEAKARYVHRYTMEHLPQWARIASPGGKHYAPQYRSDREWYTLTKFPGEPGLHGNAKHCQSGPPTWPLGVWLDEPYEVKR